MEEIDKLKEELSFMINEMRELRKSPLRNRWYGYWDKYVETNRRRENILNKINQIRLKYWYWK